ncbi:hypothetical protein OSTOST_09187 [Ostertagia ostertagi]
MKTEHICITSSCNVLFDGSMVAETSTIWRKPRTKAVSYYLFEGRQDKSFVGHVSTVEINPEDLERLLLDENTTVEQLASMKTTLEHLVKKVDSLAAKEMPQVRTSSEVIAMRVASLREWPAQMLQGVATRTAKQLEDLVSSRISEECNLIEQELGRLNELEHEVCADKKVVCETLTLVLHAKALQSDMLGRKVEQCEKPRQDPRRGSGGDAPATVYEQLNVSEFDNVEYHLNFDPIAAAQARKDDRLEAEDQGLDPIRRRRGVKAQDELLNHLLLSKLDGYPKAVAKALPKHIREGNFDGLVDALRSKFEVNSSSIQMKAYMDLKRLRRSGDVTRYCLELERLTREAYPDASEEELSRTRAGELLYTTMEIAPKEAAYEMVKAMAQRCERSREVATAIRETSTGYNQSREERKRRIAGQKFKRVTQKILRHNQQAQLTGEKRAQRMNSGNSLDCPLPKKSNAKEKSASASKQAGTARVFTASLKKWICGAVEAMDKSELVGEQTTTEVHLLGMSVRALLDTGSQISIIPLRILQTAWESGFDLDADVEEIPLEQQKQVLDASGRLKMLKELIKRRCKYPTEGRQSEECNEALEKLVRHYAHAFAVSEQELTQTTLVEHSIETGDAMPIRQKARPVPLGTRVELRRILNDLQERKIIEPKEECWGDERKEEELRMKNSQFLSPYGLALAMQAHRRRCHIYSEAIEAAQGMRFEHPALFPWAVKYDIGAHITTALAMLKHISVPGASTVTHQRVFLGLRRLLEESTQKWTMEAR